MSKLKIRTVRTWFAIGVVGLVLVGMGGKFGWGSACALGFDGLAYICPLGLIEATVAGRTVYLQVLPSVAITLAVIVLFGAAFCAWACPTRIVKILLRREAIPSRRLTPVPSTREHALPTPGTSAAVSRGRWWSVLDSRHVVLAGAVISSALFGFPVFCLICPVGLFFGTLFAVGRLFSIQQAGLEILVFPAILAVEFLVLRNWCRSLCPLGALLSLLSSLNPFFRPAMASDRCLRSKGANCQVCHNNCPEEIDLREPNRARPLLNCTKCLACSEACPTHAITFPFVERSKATSDEPVSRCGLG